MAGKTPKQEETGSERMLGRIGSERYARFMEKFAPLEKEFLSDIADQREERRAQIDMASNDQAIAGSQVRQAAGAGLQRESNPLGLAASSSDTAAASGLNRSQLESDLDNQYAGDLGALAAQGSGQAGQAISGLSAAAEAAGQRAADEARMRLQSKQAQQQAVASLFGTAAQSAFGGGGTPPAGGQAGGPMTGGSLGLSSVSSTGVREAWNQPAAGQQQYGLTTYPYPGA